MLEHDLPGGHSPGYFAALNQPLPTSPLVWRNDPAAFSSFPDFFLAHELAHQWWGQAVGWKNYHEQWISEGFAQYFSALYAQRANPTRQTFARPDNPYNPAAGEPGAEVFPFVLTTYRLTEHHTAGGMSRSVPYLSELQPEMFCEVSPELAKEAGLEHGGWATIYTARSAIEARVLVTDRIASVTVQGRRTHQVGLPYHWGQRLLTQGDSANDIGRDAAGNLYVTGNTFSMDFPATIGAFDSTLSGTDAFVAEVKKRSTPIVDDWIKKAGAKGVDAAKILAEFREELKKVAAGK